MLDPLLRYEIVYALAAGNGREGSLFGSSAPSARDAFGRGLCGDIFPELWFELPLCGEPWFDLHMLVHRQDMYEGIMFAGLGGAYADALAWFSTSRDTRQLALSFDSGSGTASDPAIQLLLDRESMEAAQGFLAAAGRADAADSYRSFVLSLPKGWYACYSGVFPARGDARMVRVECLVDSQTQQAYASEPGLIREHLEGVGTKGVGDELVRRIQELARYPFPLEFQFDVGADGTALPKLGASLRFDVDDWIDAASCDAIGRLFGRIEAWGLADGRWKLLKDTMYARRLAKGGEAISLWCYPAFVKLRWAKGAPLDAKAYLIAGTSSTLHG